MVGAGQVLSERAHSAGSYTAGYKSGWTQTVRRARDSRWWRSERACPACPSRVGAVAGVARGDRRQDGARCRGDGATWMMQTPLWPWPRPSRPQWRKRWWEVLSSPTAELRPKAHRLHAHELTMRPRGTLKAWVPGAVARARLGLGELPRVPLQRSFSGQQRWLSSS